MECFPPPLTNSFVQWQTYSLPFILLPGAAAVAAAAKSLQLCPTLCDPRDGSPPGSPFPGILQERTLEWVAVCFSNAWKWSHSVMSDSSRPPGLQPTRLICPWDFPGKSTGVVCHCLPKARVSKKKNAHMIMSVFWLTPYNSSTLPLG